MPLQSNQSPGPSSLHSLQSLENSVLLSNFETLVKNERRISREVLQHIAEIESRRLYADEGYSTTHDWLVGRHGYSHASAGRRVSAARMLCAVPEAAAKIETGELCMTTLNRVQSAIRFEEKRTGEVLTPERKSEVISKIEMKPKTEIERSLAEMFQVPAPRREILQAKCDGETRLHLTFSNEQMRKIERAAELLSHKLDGPGDRSLARAIEAMAEIVIAAKDPLVKIVRPRMKSKAQNDTEKNQTETSSGKMENASIQTRNNAKQSRCGVGATENRYNPNSFKTGISPSTRNAVYRRDDGRCQFETHDGVKCLGRKFTQIDHIVPRALGGSNEPENLRVLCRTHNLLMAERIFGKAKIAISKSQNR